MKQEWEKEEKEEAWDRKKRKMEVSKEETNQNKKDFKANLMDQLKEGVILDMNDPKNTYSDEEAESDE